MKLYDRIREKAAERFGEGGRKLELRRLIWISFTATAVAITLFMGLSFYGRFMAQNKELVREENEALLEQGSYHFGLHLRNMMKVSDSLYYSVIKKADLSRDSVTDAFQLLYDTNKEHIERIALFSEKGELLDAVPAGKLREDVDIHRERWYRKTLASEENITFGVPEVEHIFELTQDEYTRILPMTRVVQMNMGDEMEKGILLIELRRSSFEDIFSTILLGGGSYLYLTDRDGKIIYHPHQELVESGYVTERELDMKELAESGFIERKFGEKREYFVKTVGYTGWKLIGVVEDDAVALNTYKNGLLVLFLMLFFLSVMAAINFFLSRRVSAPMRRLEEAVNRIEEGDLDTKIEPSGFYEVWHLGQALNQMKENLKKLMNDIVAEHESRRKSEIMTLQNQINPHFLYNTLDIIVWMIENGKREEAVNVVTALARFFRISLSRGKTVIPIGDEVEHVRNYLMIQEMRFKNRFTYSFDIEEGVEELGTIKLILQPIVENAIYHAMEFMDGDGEILVSVKRDGGDVLLTVEDNGCGMTPEVAERLMAGEKVSRKGSHGGVGIHNVQERLRLVFGKEYGLSVFSEPDEGTKVVIRIPAVSYEELAERGLD